jgi:hypothetical protein
LLPMEETMPIPVTTTRLMTFLPVSWNFPRSAKSPPYPSPWERGRPARTFFLRCRRDVRAPRREGRQGVREWPESGRCGRQAHHIAEQSDLEIERTIDN